MEGTGAAAQGRRPARFLLKGSDLLPLPVTQIGAVRAGVNGALSLMEDEAFYEPCFHGAPRFLRPEARGANFTVIEIDDIGTASPARTGDPQIHNVIHSSHTAWHNSTNTPRINDLP